MHPFRNAIFVLLSAVTLLAQSELATITGVVTDPSGGVLANVDISVVNEATNLTTAAKTNDTGRYFAPSLKPGVYTVNASFPGFKKYVTSGVILQVNDTARLDITLTVGAVTEEVTVTASATLLQTETSDRGNVID